MFRRLKESIRLQLYLMTLLVALPTAGIILLSGLEERNEDLDKARKAVQGLTESISAQQTNLVAGAQQLLSALGQIPEVRNRRPAKLRPFLKEILRLNPQYLNILVADRNGTVWASALPSREKISLTDRRYFANARSARQFSSGECTPGKFSHRYMQAFSYPILDSKGEFDGAIVVGFDPENFRRVLQRWKLPQGSNYLLIDHRGTIISRGLNPTEVVGKAISAPLLRQMRKGAEQGFVVGAGVDDVERLSYFRRLTLPGESSPYLYILAGIPVAAVTAEANSALLRHLALFTPCLLFALLLVGWTAKRLIADPVASLEKTAQRMADGDLAARVPATLPGGELGRLGGALDHLARRLAEREQQHEAAKAALRRSESYYRSVFDNSLFGIAQTGTDMKLSHVNGAFCRLAGYPSEELIGKMTFADLTHPDDLQRSAELFARMKRGETDHYTIEKRYLARSGEVVHCLCFVEQITDDDGRYLGHSACVLDITELRASEEKMRLFFDRQVVGMALAAPDKRWLKTNRKLQQMLGYSERELERITWEQVTHPDDLAMSQVRFNCVMSGQADDYHVEKRFLRKDGSVLYADLSVACVRRYDGKADYLLVVMSDITKRKLAQEELRSLQAGLEQRVRQRTAQLEETMKELESFSYSVSHDLRSPLRHINSYLSIFLEEYGGHIPVGGRSHLERACGASVRMGKLIDDLLELSKVGRTELVRESVDLSQLADEIAAMLRETEPARQVEIVVEENVLAQGDRNLLNLVLMNLLGNAWKFTAQREDARLEFGRHKAAEGQRFYVRDNGAGFDMEYRDKLFGAFQRLHGEEYQGTGIGLATVKRIVERHGGEVWGESDPGEGATFFFTIP